MNCQGCKHIEEQTDGPNCGCCLERDTEGKAVITDGNLVLTNYEPAEAV